ncbi:MAG: response regulator [Planctomycetaceae bacterium]
MNSLRILVVEETPATLQVIERTLAEANAKYEVCRDTEDAWRCFQANTDVRCVLVRMKSRSIDGRLLSQRIRGVTTAESLPILMIITEDQLGLADSAIDSGATDIMVDPFEPRELRMRTSIRPNPRNFRIDDPHQFAVAEEPSVAVKKPAVEAINYQGSVRPLQSHASVVSPKFDPQSQRFTYDASASQLARWSEDPAVTKIVLDKILVCPCCEGVPTFRPGCGCCGSAMTEPEVLIHHYACAHIAAESQFRQGSDLVCPKCRQTNLVASSDFETVQGSLVCADCGAQSTQAELIGHCLCCQHRFPAAEAATMVLTAFHVHRVQEISDRESGMKPSSLRSARESAAT